MRQRQLCVCHHPSSYLYSICIASCHLCPDTFRIFSPRLSEMWPLEYFSGWQNSNSNWWKCECSVSRGPGLGVSHNHCCYYQELLHIPLSHFLLHSLIPHRSVTFTQALAYNWNKGLSLPAKHGQVERGRETTCYFLSTAYRNVILLNSVG